MSGKEKDRDDNSPRKGKKKKEKKSWPAIRNPVSKIFPKSSKSKLTESGNNLELRPQFRSETIQPSNIPPKPSPLLRPRSIHALNAGLIFHEGPSGEAIVIDNNPEKRIKPQFGVLPRDLAEKFPDEPVPAILIECVEILKNDIMKEGVFRIPGRMSNILEMKISFEQGNGLNAKDPDTYAIAGLLAQFFRELPEPLLMNQLYTDWIDAVKTDEETSVKQRLAELIKELPEPNYNILKYFIQFLTLVGKHSGANRMGPRNLALVFGASLLNPPSIEQYDLQNIKLQCNVIEYFIRFYSFLFEGIEDEENAPKKTQQKQIATIPAGMGTKPAASEEKTKKTRFIHKRKAFFTTSSTGQSSLTQASVQTVVSTIDLGQKGRSQTSGTEFPSGENPNDTEPPQTLAPETSSVESSFSDDSL